MRVEIHSNGIKTHILEEKTRAVVYIGDYRPLTLITKNKVMVIFKITGYLEYDYIEIKPNEIRLCIK